MPLPGGCWRPCRCSLRQRRGRRFVPPGARTARARGQAVDAGCRTLGSNWGHFFGALGATKKSAAALQEAAKLVPGGAPLLAAKVLSMAGPSRDRRLRTKEALIALNAAEQVLENCSDKDADDWIEAWLDVQLSHRSNRHYWRAETELQAAVLARARSLVEARAGPRQTADFCVHMAGQRWRASRFMVDEGIVADVRSARALFLTTATTRRLPLADPRFVLLLQGDLTAAETELEGALDAARRGNGGRPWSLFCLIFLAWARLRQNDVAGVKEMAGPEARTSSRPRPSQLLGWRWHFCRGWPGRRADLLRLSA